MGSGTTLNGEKGMDQGRLEVICGPMFSGKTGELIRRLRREQIARKSTLLLKPEIDTRYGKAVSTHDGVSMEAVNFNGLSITHPGEDFDVIGIDEVQFFPNTIESDILWLVEGLHKTVIVSGLDMTYRREPFSVVPNLMALADSVTKLYAVCHLCGKPATLTQRLINSQPAPFSGDTIQVGGLESYEARCRGCFQPG